MITDCLDCGHPANLHRHDATAVCLLCLCEGLHLDVGDCDDSCVVCLVGNGELDHDHANHQVADYHEADGTPTSEPCPGIDECPDCIDVLRQVNA